MRICLKCGVELTEKNEYPSWKARGQRWCIDCCRAHVREWTQRPEVKKRRREQARVWRENNREEIREYHRNWGRKHQLAFKGRQVRVEKRDYTGYCEICGKKRDRGLVYHHWDDEILECGVWVCKGNCHNFCGMVDRGVDLIYKKLKTVIREKELITRRKKDLKRAEDDMRKSRINR